jgi:hypothetical protein
MIFLARKCPTIEIKLIQHSTIIQQKIYVWWQLLISHLISKLY